MKIANLLIAFALTMTSGAAFAPPAPAGVTFTAPEAESWADLWATGESTMWTDASLTPVAVLVRLTSRIFDGEASTAEVAQADRLMAALGLTPAARSRLGWEVAS